MTVGFLTDEHVPSVFVTALRSSGYDVERANDVFGEATTDEHLLQYCAEEGRLLVTHDKKDFGGSVGESIDHSGIVIYTDPVSIREDPAASVRSVERILESYPPAELEGERVWLDQWRR